MYVCVYLGVCSPVPVDFVLKGVMPDGGEVGLQLIVGYRVRVLTLFMFKFGGCQPRGRLHFLVLVK